MANRPITIVGSNTSTGALTLSDQGKTNVDPGDTVTWLIGQNSGVQSVTAVTDYPNSTDVFNPDPAKMGSGNSANWQGTVNPNIAKGSEETYYIQWTAENGGGSFTYDPKIQVNP
jgi:hypothetical protein